jgi:hypothetical protein
MSPSVNSLNAASANRKQSKQVPNLINEEDLDSEV